MEGKNNTILFVVTIVYIIYFGFAIAYFGIVHLNSTFTFSDLPVSAIPWYGDSSQVTWATIMDRYSLEYFLMFLDFLHFLLPFVVSMCMLYEFKGIKFQDLAFGYIFMDGVAIWFPWIFRMVEWGLCGSFGQICRAEDSGSNPMFSTKNQTFMWLLWFNFIYGIVIWAPSIYIVSIIPNTMEKWRENVFDDILKRENPDRTQRKLIIEALQKKGAFKNQPRQSFLPLLQKKNSNKNIFQ